MSGGSAYLRVDGRKLSTEIKKAQVERPGLYIYIYIIIIIIIIFIIINMMIKPQKGV